MFKNFIKTDKQEVKECERKMQKYNQDQQYLQKKIYFEHQKLNNIPWRSEAERVVETNDTLRPLEKKLAKTEKKWVNQWKQLEVIENRPYCQEERIQQQALKDQEIKKLAHVKMNEPSIYHDGHYYQTWSGKKMSRQWNERAKNESNQETSCSHWDRKANSNPYSSPFK